MNITGMTREFDVAGRKLLFFNQKSPDWTHIYEYQGDGENLHDAGCGVFALCHAVEWMHGIRLDPNRVAEISVAVGGRGDDGTDRPKMLQGMMDTGFARECGFRYEGDGLLNDNERLFGHVMSGNTALCNLRAGHIVALLAARQEGGRRMLLAMDSVAESCRDSVQDHVYAVVPGTEISYPLRNGQGVTVGYRESWAMFWVDVSLPRDFNLLYRTEPAGPIRI